MIQTLYLFENQNNYFNRRIITQGVDTIESILANPKLIKSVSSQNIAMNDKVEITFTLNCFGNEELFNRTPDYMVMKSENDSHVVKLTRWFIMRMEEGRNGQFEVQARRDLLADFKTNILNADSYIERGFVYQNDPLIYNEEGYSLNQIKVGEYKIKDKSRCGWIVGYISRKENGNNWSKTINFNSIGSSVGAYTDLPTNVKNAISGNNVVMDSVAESYKFNFNVINYGGTNYYTLYNIFYVEATFNNGERQLELSTKTKKFNAETEESQEDYENSLFKSKTNRVIDFPEIRSLANNFLNRINLTLIRNQFIDTVEESNSYVSNPMQYDNKTYSYGTDTTITLHTKVSLDAYINTDVSNNNNVYTDIMAAANATATAINTYEVINRVISGMVSVETLGYTFETTYSDIGSYTLEIPTTRNSLNDAPYDMFCMPYSEFDDAIIFQKNLLDYNAKSKVSLDAAEKITEELGSRLYDIQILPYCPIQDFISYDAYYGSRVRNGLTEHYDFEYIYKVVEGVNTAVGIILFPYHSKENFKLYWNDSINPDLIQFGTFNFSASEECPTIEYSIKLHNEGEILRLNSPNYASTFEFNRAKNGLTIEYWNVSLHYKPYQPFVRVAPDFKGIYGYEYSDNRGLILAGDFSLPMVSDAWTNYQIQNKNYQLMFDRGIKQMTDKYTLNWATGMADLSFYGEMGAISGLLAGSKSGGTAGGVIGGVMGGVGGAYNPFKKVVSSGIDTLLDMSYKRDMFKYTLGNIKALPDTITKVGCLNNIFKIYPVLEKYQCTDSEAELVLKNIKYNGMIVNKEGKIINYVDSQEESYVKAKIIRFNEENFDTTIARAIAQEVSQGFYIDINGVSKYE